MPWQRSDIHQTCLSPDPFYNEESIQTSSKLEKKHLTKDPQPLGAAELLPPPQLSLWLWWLWTSDTTLYLRPRGLLVSFAPFLSTWWPVSSQSLHLLLPVRRSFTAVIIFRLRMGSWPWRCVIALQHREGSDCLREPLVGQSQAKV